MAEQPAPCKEFQIGKCYSRLNHTSRYICLKARQGTVKGWQFKPDSPQDPFPYKEVFDPTVYMMYPIDSGETVDSCFFTFYLCLPEKQYADGGVQVISEIIKKQEKSRLAAEFMQLKKPYEKLISEGAHLQEQLKDKTAQILKMQAKMKEIDDLLKASH